ncbi:MAG: SIMPL domain-containing protein [Pseudorhodoplanes sp.]
MRAFPSAIFCLALALLAASSPRGYAHAASERENRPFITVTGEATITAEPDLAQLRAGVVTEAKTAREAAEANSRAMANVMAAIRALGIAERDVQTSRYAIVPIYDQSKPPRERLNNFAANNALTIKIRQTEKTGEIIDKLFAAGANQIGGVEFIVTNASKLLDDARKEAVADARRKAELLASAAGASLGRVYSIGEQSAGMERGGMMYARAASPAPETPIAAGERTLRVTVSVNFDLQR